MIKMEIAFDCEKIECEGKYDINKMWAIVDDFMVKKQKLRKLSDGVYSDYSGYDGYGSFLAFGSIFEDYPWFMQNIKKWEWIESDDDDPEDIYYEDWKALKEARRIREARHSH